MNFRCGSYQNPQENLSFWVPSTPEKPSSQRSSNARPEMAKNNPSQSTENWGELLGIYSGFLQNDQSNAATTSAMVSHTDHQIPNTVRLMGQNYSSVSVRDVPCAVLDRGLSQNSDVMRLDSTNYGGRILNHRANSNVFWEKKAAQPQRVNSLLDLLSSTTSHVSSYVLGGPAGLNASQLMSYVSNGPTLHESREAPNDRLMISYWPNSNLRLLPSVAANSSPSSLTMASSPFVPITPDQHKHKLSSTGPTLDTSSSSPPTKENGEIIEIDLNKTPQQKPPKRRKVRPKVVIEGKKQRRAPNKEKKTPPSNENARTKRKYVRRKAVESPSTAPSTEKSNAVVIEDLDVGPPAKSCRRFLNFDLNVEAGKESHGLEGSEQRQGGDYRENQVFDANCGQERSKVAEFEPHGSSRLELTPQQQPKNHTLMNIIARSLSVQSASVNIYNHANNGEPSLQICGKTHQPRFEERLEMGNYGDRNARIVAESSVMDRNGGFIYEDDKGQSSCMDKNAQVHSSAEQIGQNTLSKEWAVSSIIAEPSVRNESTVFPSRVSVKKRSKKVALMDKTVKKAMRRSKANSSKENRRLQEKSHTLSVDFITERLRVLQIGSSGKELVPYGGDGSIVPFVPAKKRVPRPRVELDSETNRLWNLLMGKEGVENADTMDADKQKWWDEERKVVRGRVDSFIARMHLVQGDRRFSKWKGSVVDSVIGVFLTQNVSDHLSSSAFMSLVSKFPAKKSTSVAKTSSKKNEVRITFPDEESNQPFAANHSSVTSVESSEHKANKTAQIQTDSSSKLGNVMNEEDIVSSQGSTESCSVQNAEDLKYGSGSNSEAEEGVLSVSKKTEAIDSQQIDQFQFNVSSFPGNLMGHQDNVNLGAFVSNDSYYQKSAPYVSSWTNLLLGLQSFESDVFASSRKEGESYLGTTEFANGREGVGHASNNIGQSIECSFLGTQTKHQQELNGWDFTNRTEGGTHESTSATKPAEDSPQYSRIRSGGQQHLGSGEKKQNEDGVRNTAENTRKRKAEKKEKAEPIIWDTLRTKAESEAGVRGRTYENLDSLDYEALRDADVREISDTIKERGMNNMLAERIKDFLNRLERDHGKVDLEWLRDVQPDKAKDYLLSIRGLGLKSVECVRLLTLHHLAFPVDTNVGRIAVRLGWVPLQPLPESLQLHLLELYPVLESIQKYLWPRLCKLDQETLYELHYQMITFGKVFCTKRDPNCNACPMRAECRHFASAFASARLTLPAPEEKRIVTSVGPIESDDKGPVEPTNKPMLLTTVDDSSETGAGFSKDCEPLIEEPSTPEQPIDVQERDIEDFYYEDPDEIPVIKLNVEEFATNLQNFMQGKNMEIGENDVSKALVALSPALASIPMPKLKSISRLRTEHQVYQLPDSHPLLKEMDRREPDDPSPYLLAIWTPGETADSVTPPEIACSCREVDGECNNEECFSCSSAREAQAETVRGTILIPCRTAMRGSFPLNGTYFQVNEVFADHDSSLNPIAVPRGLIWSLPRRTVFFGTSVSTIFKGMSTEEIQICFWKGFVCVRGFDQKSRAPRPLRARLHFPASKMAKKNE